MKKLDVNEFTLAHLTLILSLHYHVKCRSRIGLLFRFASL